MVNAGKNLKQRDTCSGVARELRRYDSALNFISLLNHKVLDL